MTSTLGRTLTRPQLQKYPIEVYFDILSPELIIKSLILTNCQVEIFTEKDHYLPGEKLTGKIYIVAKELVRVSKLVAVVEGYNSVAWKEGRKSLVF